jgi:FtsP/CotA-like multicopper oxidase with cupredoxin domain
MFLVDKLLACLTAALNILSFSSFNIKSDFGIQQPPFSNQQLLAADGPVFKAPGRLRTGEDAPFTCDYKAMKGFEYCSTPQDRTCWLKNPTSGARYDTTTDYELLSETPQGITRKYTLTVGNATKSLNVDGQDFGHAILYNDDFPGPWIQACWGDTVEVTVNVESDFTEGTSVHFHGIRQWETMHMDGVPGITQCPIAPGSSFTYKWRAMQYGSAWYHSHYSLQYADGLLGPLVSRWHQTSFLVCSFLTLPASKRLFMGRLPLHLMRLQQNLYLSVTGVSYAFYRSFLQVILTKAKSDHNNAGARRPINPTILLAGIGNITRCWPTAPITKHQQPFTLNFQKGKSYLLRIINTAYESAFLFSIDNHLLTVVSADFVPIEPYTTNSIAVQIGQRYNIIVHADPQGSTDKDFWMRTHFLKNCLSFHSIPTTEYMKTGIIRYDPSSTADPNSTEWSDLDYETCRDEERIKPVIEWHPQNPVNPQEPTRGISRVDKNDPDYGYPWAEFAFATPNQAKEIPMRVDWQNITLLNLDNHGGWPLPWVMLPEQYTENDWVCWPFLDWLFH